MRTMRTLLLLVPQLASAADSQTEARLREALRTATTQLRALEDERSRWQASEAAQKKVLESVKEQLAAATQKARTCRRSPPDELVTQLAQQEEVNQKLTADLERCQAAVKEASEAAQTKEEQRTQLVAEVGSETKRATACEEKNSRMFRISQDLLEQCEKMGLRDTLMAPFEPFTGFRRVKLENLAQDFQDRLSEERAQP